MWQYRLLGSLTAISILCLSTACTRRTPVQSPDPLVENPDYVELKAGWRIRVVVPILRSGGYIVPMTPRVDGNSIVPTTGKEFIGYETDYYEVRPREGSGVRVAFIKAEAVEQGNTSKKERPILDLFSSSAGFRFVRMVYLVRESKADHDVVLVAAADREAINGLTAGVASNNSEGCQSSAQTACTVVPAGVAVIPEQRARVDGHMEWISAR